MRRQYMWRSLAIGIFLAVLGLSIIIQIASFQNSEEADKIRGQGESYTGRFRTFYPKRGEIYDRKGHLLAGNKTAYEVGVDLQEKKRDAHTLALILSANLDVDYDQVYQDILNPPENPTNPPKKLLYLVVKDNVPTEQVSILKKIQTDMEEQVLATDAGNQPSLVGLEFKPHLQRSYPEDALASNVIGFVNLNQRGNYGIEQKYNDLLAGNPVTVWVPADPNHALDMPEVSDGTTLILTLNRELQVAVEQILDQALYNTGADAGTVIVMDPHTGEILAMTSSPRMNLNEFWNYQNIYQNASEFNRAISMPYEPGSVVKILTMAAALDAGKVLPSTIFLDTGSILVGGVNIENWDHQAWGPQDMVGCIQHSLNVCLAWVASQLGAQDFYGYMQRFGLGHITGIDLAGEAAGRLKVPGDTDWYPVDLATNSYGQGAAITPIQMMMAASAFANDGKMVTPRLLYAMIRKGQRYNAPPQYAGTPITAQTAHTLNEMLAISLENEASAALVPGYRLAGKTGTAQIPTPYGQYDMGVTNTSFIGWGPVDDPRFMVYVWLEKPKSSIWAPETTAPVFSQVVERTVILLGIPPDYVRLQVAGQKD